MKNKRTIPTRQARYGYGMENERTIPTRQARYGCGMENERTIPTRTSLMRVLGRMLGENTRRS